MFHSRFFLSLFACDVESLFPAPTPEPQKRRYRLVASFPAATNISIECRQLAVQRWSPVFRLLSQRL